MGEGDIDLKAYFARFRELCPGVPVHIETISGFNREFAYLDRVLEGVARAAGARPWHPSSRSRGGAARDPWQPPPGEERKQAEQAYQRGELERSLIYCRHQLGLGRQDKVGSSCS
jgi:3-oxoisoapionate decarboxylase